MKKQDENDPGFPRTLAVSFDIVTDAPADHFKDCLVDALAYLVEWSIDPDHVIALDEDTLQVKWPDRRRVLETKEARRSTSYAMAKKTDIENQNRAIHYGESLLNEGHLLGNAIQWSRRDVLTDNGYPAISHTKLREALLGSKNLNEVGSSEIKRVLGFIERSMAFKIDISNH